ncbi:DUF2992 family protein [Nonomuraea angiospora]|uniref:DUF2992 family protein n=1 Tax=Nonomuraea angiospora TaxID=46172 RepID=UPI00378B6ABA
MLEIVEDGTVRATRFTLGSEPTDPELYEFLRRHGVALLERAASSPPVQEALRLELESRKTEAVARRKRLERRRDR